MIWYSALSKHKHHIKMPNFRQSLYHTSTSDNIGGPEIDDPMVRGTSFNIHGYPWITIQSTPPGLGDQWWSRYSSGAKHASFSRQNSTCSCKRLQILRTTGKNRRKQLKIRIWTNKSRSTTGNMNLGWTDLPRILESSWDRIRSTIPMPMVSTCSNSFQKYEAVKIVIPDPKTTSQIQYHHYTAFPLLRGFPWIFHPSLWFRRVYLLTTSTKSVR